ncbi:MAG TPA: hypothetical protein VF918_11200, partial [Anaerolineales bacterium]
GRGFGIFGKVVASFQSEQEVHIPAQSLIVPLVVPRSRKPSLLGAMLLGPRLQGLGYSTPMLKSLKKFGEEVGKAFYVAEIRDNKKS